ncbi:MAG: ABC transporter ATP-binding protein [Clostridia bacterium]|nr:ABC transporter ATP-binding protein [Clostridia bacterium]
MVEFRKITKRYGSVTALDNLSFTARKGQILGLLGQNGAGKTTALNIMTGCLAPSSGKVILGEYDLMAQPRMAKRLLGYMPEVPPLYDELTVREALDFACRLKMVVPADIPDHIRCIAGQTGLSDMLERRIGNLSKGYRQRSGLAQALCGDPEILVLDEPTDGLDPRQKAEFRQTLRELSQDRTVIFSSHILGEVRQLCSQVIILHRGRAVYDRSMENLDQEGGMRLRADIMGGDQTLIPEINKLPGVDRVSILPSETPNTLCLLLECPQDAAPQEALFRLLAKKNRPLLRLQEAGDTLEEVFLRVTE